MWRPDEKGLNDGMLTNGREMEEAPDDGEGGEE